MRFRPDNWWTFHHSTNLYPTLKASNEIYFDTTFGDGGYAKKILDACDCKVIAIDRDPNVKERAKEYEKKYPDKNNVPRPSHWSGLCLNPDSIEFWLDGKSRIHERLKYIKNNNNWDKVLLSP